MRANWPTGSPWLFPGIDDNRDGSKPYSRSTLGRQIRQWCKAIELHDEAGRPTSVTGHQFRHPLGTRLINSGVPQHIVQRLLGHASPNMTGHYARVHDTTIREQFDRYQAQRVNVAGQRLDYDPDAPTASAEWVKHNLNRIRDSLPNGYCARPRATRLPPPQRLPDLPGLPDHARLPRHPPPASPHQPAAHLARRHSRPRQAR